MTAANNQTHSKRKRKKEKEKTHNIQ